MANIITLSNATQIANVLFAIRRGDPVVQASTGTQGTVTIDVGRTVATHTDSSTVYQGAGRSTITDKPVYYFSMVNGGTSWVEAVEETEIRDVFWTSLDGTGVGIVSGTVTAASGNIAGATVTLTKGAYTVTTTSAATSGAYSFTGVPATTGYTLTAAKTGYTGDSETVNVTEDTTTTQALVIVEYGIISGTCKDDAGVDLDGATVTITKGAVTLTTTSAAGAYSIADVPVNTAYTLTVAKATYVTGSYTVNITEAATTTQNVVASRYGSISGTVTDETGNVEGAVVEFYADGTVTPVVYTATTVANGTYAIASVAPAIYDGKITKANHVDLTISNQTVVAATDKVVNGVLPEYANYAGKCTAAAGGGDLVGVVVALYAIYPGTVTYTATSAADGTYAITNIVPATYQLRVSKATFVTQFTADLATLIADADIVNANFAMVAV